MLGAWGSIRKFEIFVFSFPSPAYDGGLRVTKPPYQILEHPADIGLKIYGRTLPELFENAGRGLVALALGTPDTLPRERLLLSGAGDDREEMLVSWLNDILYYMDAEGWLFCDFHVTRIGENAVEAEGWGERRDATKGSHAIPVKAVTYHQISVHEIEDGWEAVVYVDI